MVACAKALNTHNPEPALPRLTHTRVPRRTYNVRDIRAVGRARSAQGHRAAVPPPFAPPLPPHTHTGLLPCLPQASVMAGPSNLKSALAVAAVCGLIVAAAYPIVVVRWPAARGGRRLQAAPPLCRRPCCLHRLPASLNRLTPSHLPARRCPCRTGPHARPPPAASRRVRGRRAAPPRDPARLARLPASQPCLPCTCTLYLHTLLSCLRFDPCYPCRVYVELHRRCCQGQAV